MLAAGRCATMTSDESPVFPELTDGPTMGLVHGVSTMTKPLARPSQMVQSKLLNRKPVLCAVCDRFISPFTGLPVILDSKARIIEFVHPGCCVHEE